MIMASTRPDTTAPTCIDSLTATEVIGLMGSPLLNAFLVVIFVTTSGGVWSLSKVRPLG